MTYDIDAFISDQIGRTRTEILVSIEWELAHVDYRLNGTRRGRARAAGAETYRRLLSGVAFLVRTGFVPRIAGEPEFLALRPLCVDLVKRGFLSRAVMAAFEEHAPLKAAG